MESEFSLGEQAIRFDREATLSLYRDTIKAPGADECGCTYCRNFAAQRNKAYPEAFLRLLRELGADPLKELEVFDCDSGALNRSGHIYGGWFLFSGELIRDAKTKPERLPFSYWFTASFPNGTLPEHAKICAVEFIAEIPWILLEAP